MRLYVTAVTLHVCAACKGLYVSVTCLDFKLIHVYH